VRYWGPDRTSQVMPVRAWVDEGALIAAGSDCNVSFFDPLQSIWGLVTRGTRTAGVQGPEYRVDIYTAIRLYTAAGGRLLSEDRSVGILAPAHSRMSWGSALTCWTARLTTCRHSSPR
jgi:predicted amidohydrolase YtcJ